jgi:hypothetical protein
MRDLHNHIEIRRALSPVSVADTTAQVSEIIDRQGFESLEFAIAIGSIADADATFAVKVEDGDNASLTDAAEVDDTELLGTEAAAGFGADDDDKTRKIGYIGNKRYVRLTITPAANASAAQLAAVAILGNAHIQPTA